MKYSWRAVHKQYDKLRLKYYMDGPNSPASELRWAWISDRSPYLAFTHLDEEDDPHTIELSVELRRAGKWLEIILLHELSHIRLPTATCRGRGKVRRVWQEETLRLARLGALRL